MTLGSGHPLPIDRQEWSMGRWGVLRVSGDSLVVVNPRGGVRTLLPDMPGAGGWLDEPAGILVLGAQRSDRVAVLDLNLDEVVESVELQRDPDVGLRSMKFFALDGEALGCLTENDIFALDGAGRLLWFRAHHDLTLTLDGVHDGVVHLRGLTPDLDETVEWLLDSRTGT